MLFTSYVFLFLFFPLLFLAYVATPARWRAVPLLVGSYFFYGWWRLDFCLLLLGVTAVGYVGGLWIAKEGSGRKLQTTVIVSILLASLGWFKYAGFLGESWNGLASCLLGNGLRVDIPEVVLPIGISFFTFQTVSYVVDVHRGSAPCRSPIQFAAFVAMFPQLVAGPIVRFSDVAPDIPRPRVSWRTTDFGLLLFMVGFSKKVWIANNVAPAADWVFSLQEPTLAVAWLGVAAYTVQIYFDFSGYSDMAIGLGLMFGFTFPENFRTPYRSRSITEFWQRWHISMSSFFRDYLYIPLGGNRMGAFRTLANLAVTMLLAGLWHGAGWTFVIWGGFHGLLLAFDRLWGKSKLQEKTIGIRGYSFVATLLTLLLVMIGWVLFRADSMADAMAVYSGMFGFHGVAHGAMLGDRFDTIFWGMMIIAAGAITVERRGSRPLFTTGFGRVVVTLVFLGALHELGSQGYNPFLYFQF